MDRNGTAYNRTSSVQHSHEYLFCFSGDHEDDDEFGVLPRPLNKFFFFLPEESCRFLIIRERFRSANNGERTETRGFYPPAQVWLLSCSLFAKRRRLQISVRNSPLSGLRMCFLQLMRRLLLVLDVTISTEGRRELTKLASLPARLFPVFSPQFCTAQSHNKNSRLSKLGT
jgi:hypothetical protein